MKKFNKYILVLLALVSFAFLPVFAAYGDITAVGPNDEFRVTSAGNLIVTGSITGASLSAASLALTGTLSVDSTTELKGVVTVGKNGSGGAAGTITLRDGNNPGTTETLTYAKWNSLNDASGVIKGNGSGTFSVATTSDLSEGTNLYFTNARARGAVSAGSGLSYNSTTGIFTATGSFGFFNSATGLTWTSSTNTLSLTAGYTIPTSTQVSNADAAVAWKNSLDGLTGVLYGTTGSYSALTVGTGVNNLVQLNGSSQLPAVSGALLTNLPAPIPSGSTTQVQFNDGGAMAGAGVYWDKTNGYVGINKTNPDCELWVKDGPDSLGNADIVLSSGSNGVSAYHWINDSTGKWTMKSDGADSDKFTFETDGGSDVFSVVQATQELTFAKFPVTPSAAPDADYEVANKKYVDDHASSCSPANCLVRIESKTATSDSETMMNFTGVSLANYDYFKLVAKVKNPAAGGPSSYAFSINADYNATDYYTSFITQTGTVFSGGMVNSNLPAACPASGYINYCYDNILLGGDGKLRCDGKWFGVTDSGCTNDSAFIYGNFVSADCTSVQCYSTSGTFGAGSEIILYGMKK